jgi:hypothetical protein
MSARINSAKTQVSELHNQDFIHNAKKLISNCASSTRRLWFPKGIVNLNHLEAIRSRLDHTKYGLQQTDVTRKYRQDWPSAQRIVLRKVHALFSDQKMLSVS